MFSENKERHWWIWAKYIFLLHSILDFVVICLFIISEKAPLSEKLLQFWWIQFKVTDLLIVPYLAHARELQNSNTTLRSILKKPTTWYFMCKLTERWHFGPIPCVNLNHIFCFYWKCTHTWVIFPLASKPGNRRMWIACELHSWNISA